jgi:hypothetical protein
VQTVLFLAFAILYISGSYKVHHFIGAEARNKMLKHEGGVIFSLSLCLSPILPSAWPVLLHYPTIYTMVKERQIATGEKTYLQNRIS